MGIEPYKEVLTSSNGTVLLGYMVHQPRPLDHSWKTLANIAFRPALPSCKGVAGLTKQIIWTPRSGGAFWVIQLVWRAKEIAKGLEFCEIRLLWRAKWIEYGAPNQAVHHTGRACC